MVVIKRRDRLLFVWNGNDLLGAFAASVVKAPNQPTPGHNEKGYEGQDLAQQQPLAGGWSKEKRVDKKQANDHSKDEIATKEIQLETGYLSVVIR